MEWNSKWGTQEEFLQNLAAEGQALPQALVNKPHLSNYLHEIFNGFLFLSGRRPMSGMGPPGQIPLQEIIAYVDQFEKVEDPEDRDEFIFFINYIDQLYLKDAYEKYKAATDKATNNKRPRGR